MNFTRCKDHLIYKNDDYKVKHVYETDLDTDLLILIKHESDQEKESYLMPCRKIRLIASSDFFRSMFDQQLNWAEGKSSSSSVKADKNNIPIVEVNMGGLGLDDERLLKYFEFLHQLSGMRMEIKSRDTVKVWKIAESA